MLPLQHLEQAQLNLVPLLISSHAPLSWRNNRGTMHISLLAAAAASALMLGASAQFQFFEQMFNGGQGQQQQQRDVGSDSVWYRDNYEAGEFAPNASPGCLAPG
jgi:hypothetical protein